MKHFCRTKPLALLIFFAPLWLHAFERDHQAHTHGEGTLTLVIEQHIAHIHLALPAMDVVGFEHMPTTDQHRQAIRQTKTLLTQAEKVIQLADAAQCELASHQLTSQLLVEATDATAHEHDDTHHEQHEHEHEHEHEHHEHAHHHDKEAHADFEIEYRFHCKQPADLSALQLPLFDELQGLREIALQIITASGQHLLHASPDHTAIQW